MTVPVAVPRPDSHVGATIAAVLAGLWAVFVAVLSQFGGWLTAQILLTLGTELPHLVWPIIGVVSGLLAAGPALAIWLIPRHPAIRATGRALTIGGAALGVGTGLRVISSNVLYLLALAVCAGLAWWLLRRPHRPTFSGWGIAAGLVVLLPFLWAGGLGGISETLAALLASAALGGLAASTVDAVFWDAFDTGPVKRILLGGLVAGAAFALIAAGAGGSGVQLLLLVVLPPLGFAAATLRSAGPLAGVAAFGPLGFVDPAEVNLFLIEQDVPFWATIAAVAAWVLALLVAPLSILAVRWTQAPPDTIGSAAGRLSGSAAGRLSPDTTGSAAGRASGEPAGRRGSRAWVSGAAAGVMALCAAGVYVAAGQPGFFGDQLFVILKDQAPLGGLPTTTGLGAGRDARVTAVYRRLVDHAVKTQGSLRAELSRFSVPHKPYYLVNAILVNGGPELKVWLENHSAVDRVLTDQRLRPLPRAAAPARGELRDAPRQPPWNLRMVGAPEAWARGKGDTIVVGSSDSGVDGSHPALASGFRGGDDSWYDPWDGTSKPVDTNGHGTHTLGTAVGGLNIGVAPAAKWVGCVNLDRNMGSPSFYLDCLQFMLAPFAKGGDPFRDGRPARAPHVLTNSWGCPPLEGCDAEAMRPATNAIAAAGIAFVAAAGNSGDQCGSIKDPPATDPAAFTVAAVDANRRVTSFSSRGQPASGKPDIAAPGADIVSALPGGTYGSLDGTSMATPHVAGVIALLWSARPELVGDLDETYARLREGATAVSSRPTCGDLEDAGAGIVNALDSLAQ